MPERISFHSLATPPRKRVTRTFHDPRLPESGFTLQLEQPDALTDYLAAEVAAELVRRYITGDEALGMAPSPFMVGSEAKQLTARLCDHAALIHVMQPDPWDLAPMDRYEPEELLQMAFKVPGVWRQVRRWTMELDQGAEIDLPNDSGPPEGSSSDPPLSEAQSILASWPGSPTPSGASTGDLAART